MEGEGGFHGGGWGKYYTPMGFIWEGVAGKYFQMLVFIGGQGCVIITQGYIFASWQM